ncbi:hypothetical protein GlitD10_0302 [Gloeomargarita lithophora Alchichica-D10]|uniref:DUF1788 domain-containing protein n=2 Tax=Gloeomargarita TaxID=1188227 RepID=A0A1J0A9N3_9CYAN|nr:hypothetical protein GlitD10_0302 [Gloeomargarita lithophora Alchichica-D10]
MRISAYEDLPFAIFQYLPNQEWELRKELDLLMTRLKEFGKQVYILPLSQLLQVALDKIQQKDKYEGLEALIVLEQQRGYLEAQRQMITYLSEPIWAPLWNVLAEVLLPLDPCGTITFLTGASALAPGLFQVSTLLNKMHNRTKVPTILFYPGSIEGTTGLRFMDLADRNALGNYRVKIYS